MECSDIHDILLHLKNFSLNYVSVMSLFYLKIKLIQHCTEGSSQGNKAREKNSNWEQLSRTVFVHR